MIPNIKTQKVMDATDRGENLIRFESVQDLFDYLYIGSQEISNEEEWV